MSYIKTELGQTALHDRTIALTPRQRSAFIMFDGKRSTEDVIKATAGLGISMADVEHFLAMGLLAVNNAIPSLSSSAARATPAADAPVPMTAKTGGASHTSASAGPDAIPATRGASALPTSGETAHYTRAYPIATRLTAGLGLRGFRLNLAVEAAGDLKKLQELAPKIRDAVGPDKFKELEDALYD